MSRVQGSFHKIPYVRNKARISAERVWGKGTQRRLRYLRTHVAPMVGRLAQAGVPMVEISAALVGRPNPWDLARWPLAGERECSIERRLMYFRVSIFPMIGKLVDAGVPLEEIAAILRAAIAEEGVGRC